MTSNGVGNPGSSVFVLYKIANSECDDGDPLFNAFSMKRGPKGPTLADVKQNCAALHGLSHLGPEGYHWRVCVEDKPVPGATSTEKNFSWWDVQDENAVLPVKEASQSELSRFFSPPKADHSSDAATKAAKGAFKSLGKAMSQAVTGTDGMDHGPPVSVVAFKLLDLVKMHDDFGTKHHGRGGHIPQPHPPARTAAPRPPTAQPAQRPQQKVRASAPAVQQRAAAANSATASRRPAQQARPQQPAPQDNLMDFGPPTSGKSLQHAASLPATLHRPNETRAQKLKREYAKKNQTSNRVWDDVDQRWVEVDPAAAGVTRSTASAPPGADVRPNSNGNKVKGISLDPANAVGKSANVQAAVNNRVNQMRESQAKALQEVREREEKKKKEEAEEDAVRQKLEPRIKTWSEEHGKKKQLRALLASLHTILWPEAKWKQISIGDILDDSKLKRCYHKASRVVHPDKTHHLDAEKRFLAKRIFDALTQAKVQYDNGAQ